MPGQNTQDVLYIVIKTQFPATHCWPDCPYPEVSYLRNPHRHLFYVTMKWKVTHDNRDKEFIMMKNKINHFIRESWYNQFIGSTSCEMLARQLANKFDADFVSVFEDNENGAEYARI